MPADCAHVSLRLKRASGSGECFRGSQRSREAADYIDERLVLLRERVLDDHFAVVMARSLDAHPGTSLRGQKQGWFGRSADLFPTTN